MAIHPELIANSEIEAAVLRLIANGEWAAYDGDSTRNLQHLLSEAHRRPYVQLCCSGTLAVELALRGLKLGPEDEVILSAYDFPGNFRAIEATGARPVLVDIADRSWSLDPDGLEEAHSEKVRAILVSHLHGTCADMKRISAWAAERSIYVIEDACQAHGALVQGKAAGSWGDVSVLSFGGSKLISSGRGGAILTSDPSIDQRIRIYRDRGNDAFPMSQLQACVIPPQWNQLDELTRTRWQTVQVIERELSDCPTLSLATRREEDIPAFYKWSCQLRSPFDSEDPSSLQESEAHRQAVLDELRSNRIESGEGFRGFALRSHRRCRSVGELMRARKAAAGTILVHHSNLLSGSKGIELIVDAIKKGSERLR